jgi:hypothetical protein
MKLIMALLMLSLTIGCKNAKSKLMDGSVVTSPTMPFIWPDAACKAEFDQFVLANPQLSHEQAFTLFKQLMAEGVVCE